MKIYAKKVKKISHVEVVRSIKTVVVETNNVNGLQDFKQTQNMHNSAFRYKLDTSSSL